MKKAEKLQYLAELNRNLYIATRREEEMRISDSQSMWCCCGALATGLHESRCSRFRNKVDAMVIERLAYLLPKS